ncbi:MAG TPA: PAS domain S-box protein [Vicinamibacterales bacterium]
MHFLIFAILYTLVYLAAGVGLAAYPLVRIVVADALLILLVLTVCAVIFRRRRDWEGTHRLFWDAAAAGFLLWCIGECGFAVNSVSAEVSWVQWHTMFSLCGGIGPVVALLARPHRGIRRGDSWPIGLDMASYATLMGFVYAYFIMVPSVVPADGRPSPQSTLLTLVQVQRFVLFAGLAGSAWFARKTAWSRTFIVLTAVTGLGFFLRRFASAAIGANLYYEGSIYDLAWIVPYMGYLWAAHESPASAGWADENPPRGGWRTAVISATPVLLIPTIGFGLLRVQPMGDPADSVRLLLTILSMVAGLGLLTLRLSVESGELERSDARMRLLAAATEQTGDLILITDARSVFVHANDACVQALGYTRAELQGMRLASLLERDADPSVDDIGTEVRKQGVWRGTLVHRRKSGDRFPASCTVVALRDGSGHVTHFVGVQRDITDELKLRDKLVHSERLSAVGELVAGVAHEINNPLQTIIGSVELMLEENGVDHTRDLHLIRQEATRAGQIVRNLLAFVRKSPGDRVRADLNQIARATAGLREHHLAQQNITLALDLADGMLPVLVNREEIQQVALNLVLNAEHAIGDHPGRIVIRTGGGARLHTLQVVDDGPGVTPELRGRVFEPFFTTKEVGEGTGLGLSLGLGIARAHGGSLELLDTAAGAAFQLTLPAQALPDPATAASPPAADAASAVTPARRSTPSPAAGTRYALVIEDERPIRDLLVRLLTRRQYTVIEAASLAESKTAAAGALLDLVLCDLRLADGNGLDCLRHLSATQPDVARRFVFVTGDPSTLSSLDREFAGIPVLTKPFTVSDLERVLGGVDVAV